LNLYAYVSGRVFATVDPLGLAGVNGSDLGTLSNPIPTNDNRGHPMAEGQVFGIRGGDGGFRTGLTPDDLKDGYTIFKYDSKATGLSVKEWSALTAETSSLLEGFKSDQDRVNYENTNSHGEFDKHDAVGAAIGIVNAPVHAANAVTGIFGISPAAPWITPTNRQATGEVVSGEVAGQLVTELAGALAVKAAGRILEFTHAYGLTPTCFVAGTLVHEANSVIPIEEVRAGDRVAYTRACDDGPYARSELLRIRADVAESGGTGHLEMLRPAPPGGTIQMGATFIVNIPSIDVHGVGRVVGVERFILVPGDGCLVTTTISHEVNHITSVRTGTEVLDTTPGHPFYSPSRGAWIEAGRLNEGDSVVQRDGAEQLILDRRTTEVARTTVYNFEVEDSHTYFVGESGIWVHNYPGDEGVKLTKGARKEIGNMADIKDTKAADAILARGGNGSNVQRALGSNASDPMRSMTVGEIANLAATGDEAAKTAMKIIKQAASKGQKY
jgi:hypothetical protein